MFVWLNKMKSEKKCLKYAVKVSVAYQFNGLYVLCIKQREVHRVSKVSSPHRGTTWKRCSVLMLLALCHGQHLHCFI